MANGACMHFFCHTQDGCHARAGRWAEPLRPTNPTGLAFSERLLAHIPPPIPPLPRSRLDAQRGLGGAA